jgi:hypothetical protein
MRGDGIVGRQSAMNDTKDLLRKIAALRQRLSPAAAPPIEAVGARTDPAHAVLDKVEQGGWHNRLIDRSLRPLDPAAQPPPLPPRLTASGARLLLKGRDLLQALRGLADDPVVGDSPEDPLAALHASTVAMIDTVLRAVQAFPHSATEQLRLCEGLDAILDAVDERVGALTAGLHHRRRETGHIDYLAEILRRLAAGQPVAPPPLLALADTVVHDAQAGQRLRFLHASPEDPARFAAAHALTVAQVLARLLLHHPDANVPVQLAVMAALVHDVGMLRVPAEILGKATALTDEERRLVEKHTSVGGPMVAQLWPGGGWPVDLVTDHHERPDGTGYPFGRKDIQVAEIVQLLAVCDTYAALCCPRPHRPALDSRAALTETLQLAERDVLDRDQAERLLVLSFYPAGSVVELNDGAAAMVLSAQPGLRGMTSPARPIVLMLTEAQAQPLALPRVVDLLQQKERSIVRSLAADERRRLLGQRYPELV